MGHKGKRKLILVGIICCLFLVGGMVASYQKNTEVARVSALVSWGKRGDLVRQTQQRLQELGYYKGKVDGIFGTGTYEAILAFQKDNGLKADGIAGAGTLKALGISTNQGEEPSDFEENVRLLASAIHGEGRGEPYEGQVAIGAVILNRVNSEKFPNSIPGVIFQGGAFDAVADGQISLEPNETAFQAARDALNGWDPTEGALYYWNPSTATSRWIWSVPITKSIGRHVFGTK